MSKPKWFLAAMVGAAISSAVPYSVAMAATMTLSGSPSRTATVNQYYYFKPTLANANPRTTRFSISGRPSWAGFDPATGALGGKPTLTGTWSNIRIMSFDGMRSTALAEFTVTVRPASTAVKISGSPPKVADAGAYYYFRPTVTAPKGSSLRYSIANKPAWATFNAYTGALSGTPSSVSTYRGVSIRVTDSKSYASLPAFDIAVARQVSGSALLSWVKPVRNTDGTSLSNLAGFRVHYGNSLSSLTKTLTISGANSTSAHIDGLTRGTWYFAVVAYTTSGIESALSAAAAKSIY